MSTITANISLLDYEARTKSHSRHMRNYQKVSESNLDDASIASYLKSRNLTKTLTTFLMQTNSKKSIEPILDIFQKGAKRYESSIESFWQLIIDAASRNSDITMNNKIEDQKPKLIKLELYINIWYCIDEKQLNETRLNTLKHFIKNKGQILSEIPELLPYFVLPYVNKNAMNPIVKRIYSPEWKAEVRQLLQEVIGVESDSMEQEWFNIIVDMIEICDELIKNISIESSTQNVKAMIERVSLYKTVVDKNRIEFRQHEPKCQNVPSSMKDQQIALNLDNIRQVKQKIQNNYEDRSTPSIGLIMKAYNKIQHQILHRSQMATDKTFVSELIAHDIFCLKQQPSQLWVEYEWMKLLKVMSTYHKCRNYLVQHKYVIRKIIQVIDTTFANKNAKFRTHVLLTGFGIFQRIMVRQQLFQQINKSDKVYEIAVYLIKKHELDFEKSNLNTEIFETMLGCIFGAVMHRKGRTKVAKTQLFEMLIGILKRLPNMNNLVGIELLICSTIYLLLVEEHIRYSAVRLHLKDILLNRMIEKKSGSYDTYVQYIIERVERNDEEQEIDSDEDTEKEEEFDHNIVINHEVLILCSSNNEKPPAPVHQTKSNDISSNQNHNLAANIQEGYARDRYSWKKKWMRQ